MTHYVIICCGDSYWDGRYWGDRNKAKIFTKGSRDFEADLKYLRNIANLADPEDRMIPALEYIEDSYDV